MSHYHAKVRIGMAALVCAGVALGIGPPAAAAGPVPAPKPTAGGNPDNNVVGGDVIRHDGLRDLVIAKDFTFTASGKGGDCRVWNKNGGSQLEWVGGDDNCNTASMNGHTYSWTLWNDTDVFTMQHAAYRVRMRDGVYQNVRANAYTRIHNDENAHCYWDTTHRMPICYVEFG